MAKKYKVKSTNSFERDMKDLKEWQDNQYNPGYYVGTGRVPRPMQGLAKMPRLQIAIGLFWGAFAVFLAFNLDASGQIQTIMVPGIISVLFLYGGISRLMMSKRNDKDSKKR